MTSDLRLAWRVFLHGRGVALLTVVMLAIAMAGTLTLFTVLTAMTTLWPDLPERERVARIYASNARLGAERDGIPLESFAHWAPQLGTFETVARFANDERTVDATSDASAQAVTPARRGVQRGNGGSSRVHAQHAPRGDRNRRRDTDCDLGGSGNRRITPPPGRGVEWRDSRRTQTLGLRSADVLVFAEVALASVLVVTALMVFRLFGELHSIRPSYDPTPIAVANIADVSAADLSAMVEQARSVPGVVAVATIKGPLLPIDRARGLFP